MIFEAEWLIPMGAAGSPHQLFSPHTSLFSPLTSSSLTSWLELSFFRRALLSERPLLSFLWHFAQQFETILLFGHCEIKVSPAGDSYSAGIGVLQIFLTAPDSGLSPETLPVLLDYLWRRQNRAGLNLSLHYQKFL